VAHFLEYFAFASTKNIPDYKIVRDLQKLGANSFCNASREHTIYAADCLREHVPQVLQTLAEVTQNPVFNDHELLEARSRYAELLHEKTEKPDVLLTEAIHAAAYHNNTVGLPLYSTEAGVEKFTDKVLSEYFQELFTPQRMVVCAVGVEHSAFLDLAKQRFTAPKGKELPPQPVNYTGGEVRLAAPDQELVHVSLAFESASWNSKDVVAMCVLEQLMGGGSSFSSGGPGKGMYSRLYVNALNQYGWVESAQCFDSIFADTSIFGVKGSSKPEEGKELVEVLCTELVGMAQVGAEELDRAKALMKEGLLMQIETRAARFEDAGRQLLTYNKIKSVEELCGSIDAVSAADVQRVARTMLKTKLSFAAYGNLLNVPRYDQIAKRFS
jgi:processing peptidase subunit alpha